jgi:hypothetical protein
LTDFDIQKMIDANASTIIWKSMTTFDQDNFWYPGSTIDSIARSNEILGWVGVGKSKPFKTV